jgi:exosortase D (VPLPA-CTERM-specific)
MAALGNPPESLRPPSERWREIAWIAAAVLGTAILVFAFAHSLGTLWGYWARPQYSHGYVIPAVAMLIAWHDFAEQRPRLAPSWSGLAPIVLGFALLVLGELSTFNSASLYGFVLALAGLAMALAGGGVAKCLLPAFVYLCFAIPPPDFLYVDVSARLQLIASTLAVDALDGLGIPVSQDGNVIDLGLYKLQVVEACSGLRYLFPLTSFSFLAAYMLKDRWWKRVWVFLFAVPIAVALNVARIVIVGVAVAFWGIDMAEGFLHAFEGWVIFMACAGLLLAEVWLLRRLVPLPGGEFRLDYLAVPRMMPPIAVSGRPAAAVASLALIGLLAVTVELGLPRWQPRAPEAGGNLVAAIPLAIGDWRGRPVTLDPDVLDMLELSDYFLADFRESGDAPPVNLYVAWYAAQGIGSAVHSPANCIPGGGWTIVERAFVSLPAVAGAPPVIANRLKIRRDGEDQLVYYWFNQRGRALTGEWAVKWYLFKDRMTTGRSDGYLLRLVTGFSQGGEAAADDRLKRLFVIASPYLPGASE